MDLPPRQPRVTPAFHLHRSVNQRATNPHSILVFPIYQRRLVWVRHPIRGWEVPGGKVEYGESPEDAVRREAHEEAGIHLSALRWLAEYQFYLDGQAMSKWVYVARVAELLSRPENSEIADVCAGCPVPTPDEIKRNDGFSPIMQDDVFQYVWSDIVPELDIRSGPTPCS